MGRKSRDNRHDTVKRKKRGEERAARLGRASVVQIGRGSSWPITLAQQPNPSIRFPFMYPPVLEREADYSGRASGDGTEGGWLGGWFWNDPTGTKKSGPISRRHCRRTGKSARYEASSRRRIGRIRELRKARNPTKTTEWARAVCVNSFLSFCHRPT